MDNKNQSADLSAVELEYAPSPLPREVFVHHIELLLDPKHIHNLETMIDLAEKEQQNKFAYFNDVEIIYYFVHLEKDMDQTKNRKPSTKRVYLHEILTFCQTLVKNAEEFDLQIKAIQQQSSLLKALEPWNIRRYGIHLQQAPLGRAGEPYKVASLAKKTTILKSFLKFLYERGYIEKLLHQELKKSSVRSEDRPDRDLTLSEVQEILNYYREQNHIVNYTILLFLATTGLRIKELTSAKVKDLQYIEGQYWLNAMGKRDKERQVYISPQLLKAIIQFRRNRGYDTRIGSGDESPLLMTLRGKPYNSNQLSNQVTKMIQDTSLPFLQHRENPVTAHTFRHFFAIAAASRGVEITKIQRTLAHDSILTTQIYLEKHLKRQDNAALSFADDLE
ncbi:tyrosine-type recombinase/integrase [Ectobacillus panaciterrae]|uniref:tyrosine-type recombinase/integrase n=1 Tax=Ectobacillus panaciterrae TaxID=363872 RepID=UPI000412E6A7|nr:site-specific integrase [Ectobacillus panaciterrae]